MNNLATAQRIIAIEPIPDADAIVKATVLGWDVVVKKDEFKVGDLVCYIQIDTVVPDKPEFEFLRQRDFRVRTIKLRKQISQGLIIPLPDGKWREGDDLTSVIGIKKYEKTVEYDEPRRIPKKWYKKWLYILKYQILVKLFPGLKKVNRVGFPTGLVPITDEERIQNMPYILQTHAGKFFVVSEKLDGSSITIIHERNRFGKSKYRICSRRFELFNKENDWYRVFVTTNFEQYIQLLVMHFKTDNVIVQGEFIGRPQGNKYRLIKDEIRLFSIYVSGKRIAQHIFYEVCKLHSIPVCPLVDIKPLNHTLESILKEAEGGSALNNIEREGLVYRCCYEPTLSFKVISNKFLLKNNE